MREMKDSGIAWVGKIPESWMTKQIKHLFSIVSGATPSSDAENWDGDVLWITPADYKTKDKYVPGGKRNLTERGLKSCSTCLIPIGSIIFSKRAPIGTVAINSNILCTNQGCLACIVKSDAVSDFFYYVLSVGTEHFELLGSGTTFKEISANNFANCKLPYPSAKVQQRIADFLDSKCAEIDALAADIQSQIDTLEQYRRSVITEAVTKGLNPDAEMRDSRIPWIGMTPSHWAVKRTKFLFEIVKRIAGKEGFDVLSVTQKGLKVKDLSDYSGQIAENYSGYQFVYPTDYVMNHMDLLTGWVDCSNAFGVTSPDYRVFRLLNQNEHDLAYFKYVFQCLYMNKIYYSFGNGVSGMGRWRLQTSTFLNFLLPVPPRTEQHHIAEFICSKVSEIDSIIDVKKKQLETLDEYKKSFIFEYVTGKKEV